MKGGSEYPFSALFTGSITAKIGGSIMPIIDSLRKRTSAAPLLFSKTLFPYGTEKRTIHLLINRTIHLLLTR